MKKRIIFLLLISVVVLTGCADYVPVDDCIDGFTHVYGFWGGLWHGFTIPFNFIGMLFYDDITIYAPSNNGNFYALGFILGSGHFSHLVRMVVVIVKILTE